MKKKKPRKENKLEDPFLRDFPEWDYPKESQEEEQYNYRCQECGYEEPVPGYVIDEFSVSQELDFPEMPILECPRCPGSMVFFAKNEKE